MKYYIELFLISMTSTVVFILFIDWIVWLCDATRLVEGYFIVGFASFMVFAIIYHGVKQSVKP